MADASYTSPTYFLPGGTLACRGTFGNFAQGQIGCAGGSVIATFGLATIQSLVVSAVGSNPGHAASNFSGSVGTIWSLLGTVPTAGSVSFIAFGI